MLNEVSHFLFLESICDESQSTNDFSSENIFVNGHDYISQRTTKKCTGTSILR